MSSLSLVQKDTEERDKYDSTRVTLSMLNTQYEAGSAVPTMPGTSLWSEGAMVPWEEDSESGQERHWGFREVVIYQ